MNAAVSSSQTAEQPLAAYIGYWADQKHAWALQVARERGIEQGEVEKLDRKRWSAGFRS